MTEPEGVRAVRSLIDAAPGLVEAVAFQQGLRVDDDGILVQASGVPIWRCQDGRLLLVPEMADAHLLNAYRMLRRAGAVHPIADVLLEEICFRRLDSRLPPAFAPGCPVALARFSVFSEGDPE